MTTDASGRSEIPTDAELDLESKRIKVASEWTDLALRQALAGVALVLMIAQIVVVNVAFFIYGDNNAWHIPAGAFAAWLSATVVEVIGVVLVIAKYLFPQGGPPPNGS